MQKFARVDRLPPYVFAIVDELKLQARRAGEDIIDFGMGNPDNPPPQSIIDKLCEAAKNPRNHRYSVSRGIAQLREAITERYRKQYGVIVDPEAETIVTIGAKDALAHLLFAIIGPGDTVASPNPAYPIHQYGVVMAEGQGHLLPMPNAAAFLENLKRLYRSVTRPPKVIMISFPHNPTTICVDLAFMREIVDLARDRKSVV